MSKFKKYAIISIVSVVLIFIAYASFMLFATHRDGFREGKLHDFSKKGVVFSTWEVELRVGTDERTNPERYFFSVNSADEETINVLKNSTGKRVIVHYKEKYWVLPWQGDSKSFIYKVELAK